MMATDLTTTRPSSRGWGHAPDAREKVPAEAWQNEKSLGDFVKAVYHRRDRYLSDRYQAKAAMSSTSGMTGGYLIPVGYLKDVWARAQETSIFLRDAQRVPLTTADTTVPHVSVSSGAAGVSPFFGGTSFVWGLEGATQAATEPSFTSVSLKANTLWGTHIISNQLLKDADDNDLTVYFLDLFGKAAGWYFDYACFRGTGTAQSMPLGILNAPGRVVVTRAGSGVAVADLAKMAERILPCGWSPPFNACWAMHPEILQTLLALTPWQVNQSPTEDGQLTIHTLRAYVTEKLPAAGTAGDIVLFIPQLYLVGVRQDVEISISSQEPALYLKNQSAVRVVFRGDGQPRLPTTVTLADGTKTAAMIVTLN